MRFTRDIANITMDLDRVENVDSNAKAGADTVTVDDLTGTDLTTLNIDLGVTGGGGDRAADGVIANGTADSDIALIRGSGTRAAVGGLSVIVNLTNLESANDALRVNGLAGNDNINASALAGGVLALTEDGAAMEMTCCSAVCAGVIESFNHWRTP